MQYLLSSAEAVFSRLCIFGPVLYIGLFMVVDAGASAIRMNRFANAMRRLEANIFFYQDADRERDFIKNSVTMRAAIRLSGVLLALSALGSLLEIG